MKERPHKLCISNTPQIAPPESAQGRNGRRRPLRERRRGRSPTRRPTSAKGGRRRPKQGLTLSLLHVSLYARTIFL